jgi:tetratricopeptide (TPR) repeat protein
MADPSCPEEVGRLVSLQGAVEVRRVGTTDWQSAGLEDTFCFGDTIRVLKDSRAAVQLRNDALLRLDQETTLTISDIENERTYIIDLLKGAAHFFSRGSKSLKVVTPYVNAAVEGTEFEVRVTDEEAKVTLMEGRVLLENDQGEVNLAKGQVGVARAHTAPTASVTVNPRDAVKWALYYPRVVQVPVKKDAALPDALRLVLRAEEKLSLGQVGAAEEDIDTALFLEPENGDAISLKAIIAVVNNRQEAAMALAEKAVAASPEAASARLAFSYALQADFDLEGALAALETAVELEPDNVLAWGRLSELRLSLEDVDGAFLAARRATALQPDLSHIQSVLGYAYLAQIKLDAAREAFEIAISLDSSAPLPQLGLGLTKIREGELVEGRRLIEVAAGLDPASSVFRSYLGKAYFEEKRDKFSAAQFAIAKELDPKDPTPWLYDAIRKQSTNRPVEALYDLQKSIELNDNRAVYRSRFQLDQDLAVRSVSLARVYNDLGFQQLGLSEGRKSLAIDPGNYSAHRLMADSYSVLPRHEIARLSELLQSQLLQPISAAPVSAGLSKNNLTLMESSLLGTTHFPTDFSMMSQNGFEILATGLAGSNEIHGGDVVVGGIQNKFSFSAGYNYFSTDGFRDNNDQTGRLANAFVQVQLTQKTSVQAEYRNEDDESGYLEFDPDNAFPDYRGKLTVDVFRVGLHHRFAGGADLLVSGIIEDVDDDVKNLFVQPDGVASGFTFESGSKKSLIEVQQQFRIKNLSVSAGAGHYEASGNNKQSFLYPLSPLAIEEQTSIEDHQENIYLYLNSTFAGSVIWTVGGDFSKYDAGDIEGDQFSPKFGAIWQASGATSLRVAVFRMVRRLLPGTSQTIEPTQIAGFNQFFDDPAGTDTWHYGIGVDHAFSPSFYGGLEYFQRDIEFPFKMIVQNPPPLQTVSRELTSEWDEKTSRAYFYWTPTVRISTALEFFYESFDRGVTYGNPSGFSKMDLFRVPLSINYFHPSGLISGVKGTYLHQDGEFGNPADGFTPGSERFWVVDALVGYRLPKRLGAVTLEVRNLFDEAFSFQDSDPANPVTVPERVVLGRFTISF